jgi:hypothetical protein
MSQERSHFKIKRGDIEIEYEGASSDVSSKFSEIFEWLKTAPVPTFPTKPEGVTPIPAEEERQERRGGARSAVVSPAIDELVKEGFLDAFKNVNQVYDELKRKVIPVSSVDTVVNALNRRVPETLDRIKDDQGRWVYRKKT